MIVTVNITNIDWDTSDYDPHYDPHNANVPDLPSEIDDLEITVSGIKELDVEIEEYLSKIYEFTTNGFNYEVVSVSDGIKTLTFDEKNVIIYSSTKR